MVNNRLPIAISDGGIDTSDATATVNDIALDKTAYVNGSKITGTANITTLNLFSQTTEPTTYDGFWVNTSNTVNKIAQVEDFLSEWNTTYMPNSSTSKYAFGSCVYDGKIYCMGGVNGTTALNTVYIYDVKTNKLTTGTPMPNARCYFNIIVYSGKIYCIGGATTYNTSSFTNITDIYDIANNTWSTGTAMPTAKCIAGYALYDDKIYCIGGFTTGNVNTNYIYSITNNSWSIGAVLPIAKRAFACNAYDGKIHCIGGATNVAVNTHDIYNIATNTWSTGAVIPTAKQYMGSIIYNGNIYCMGGATDLATSNVVSTNNIYNITNNSWSTGEAIPQARHSFGCVTYNDKIFCMCGNNSLTALNTTFLYSPNGVIDISLYNSNTLIIQAMPITTNQPYKTKLLESSSFVGGYLQYFSDLIINGVNADIYYGDGTQWIKIRSAT